MGGNEENLQEQDRRLKNNMVINNCGIKKKEFLMSFGGALLFSIELLKIFTANFPSFIITHKKEIIIAKTKKR